jgi:hypothetical protein
MAKSNNKEKKNENKENKNENNDKKSDKKASKISPNKQHKIEYEFGGPIGAFFVMFGLPFVIFALYFLCNKNVCIENPFSFEWTKFINER